MWKIIKCVKYLYNKYMYIIWFLLKKAKFTSIIENNCVWILYLNKINSLPFYTSW